MAKGRIFHSMEEREREAGLPHPFAQPIIIFGVKRPLPFKKEPNTSSGNQIKELEPSKDPIQTAREHTDD